MPRVKRRLSILSSKLPSYVMQNACSCQVRLRWGRSPCSADLLPADARKAPSRLEPGSSQFGQVQAGASGLHLAPFPRSKRNRTGVPRIAV